jgi:hypothetical protein
VVVHGAADDGALLSPDRESREQGWLASECARTGLGRFRSPFLLPVLPGVLFYRLI